MSTMIGKAKESIEDRARELRQKMRADAEYKFILKVQGWENCTYQEAVDLCTGKSPVRNPEYMLGFALSDPIMLQAMYMQFRKKDREAAKENFRSMLDEDVRELFDCNEGELQKQYTSARRS